MIDPDWYNGPGVSDVVMMSSRDGLNFDRSFLEGFVRPGLDKENWHERGVYMERGILHTSPTEMSLYGMEHSKHSSVHIERYALRTDGFVSINAGYSGGELITRPLTFTGGELEAQLLDVCRRIGQGRAPGPRGTPTAGLRAGRLPRDVRRRNRGYRPLEGRWSRHVGTGRRARAASLRPQRRGPVRVQVPVAARRLEVNRAD